MPGELLPFRSVRLSVHVVHLRGRNREQRFADLRIAIQMSNINEFSVGYKFQFLGRSYALKRFS